MTAAYGDCGGRRSANTDVSVYNSRADAGCTKKAKLNSHGLLECAGNHTHASDETLTNLKPYVPLKHHMADIPSMSNRAAEAALSGNSRSDSEVLPTPAFIGDGPGEVRQVLSELLSCNAVIPSKNRVK
jgi:hypothetical protein